MGFLEEARREAAAQEDARRREQAAIRAKEAREREEQRERGESLTRTRELWVQSRGHLDRSSFVEFCGELQRLGKGERGSVEEVREDTDNMTKGSVYFTFALPTIILKEGTPTDREERYIARYFMVEARPEGTIRVHGGWFGSTTLPLDKWKGHSDVQERALERAYKHPKSELGKSYAHFFMDDAPGG